MNSLSKLALSSTPADGSNQVVFRKLENNVISSGAGGGDKKNRKRKRGEESMGVEDGGNGRGRGRLDELVKKLCPKSVVILVKPIRFKEILISTPSKGLREVHYFSLASDSEDSSSDEDEEMEEDDVCRRKRRSKVRYEDWRIQTIRAFPSTSSGKRKKEEEEENESVLLQIPSTHDFIFNVRYAKDDLHSIMNILGGGSMSTEIIDGYFMLRLKKYFKDFKANVRRQREKLQSSDPIQYKLRTERKLPFSQMAQQQQQKPTNFRYLSVNFMPVKDRDDPVSSFHPNMLFLPNLKKLRKNSDVQLMAPLYASKHLYLAMFDFREEVVSVYDSSWHYLPMSLREGQIQAILRAITSHHDDIDDDDDDDNQGDRSTPASAAAAKWRIDYVQKSCPQFDEYSCGIYTIHYAENVLRGVAHRKNRWLLSNKRVMHIRRHIVKELLSTTAYGRRFLQAISHS